MRELVVSYFNGCLDWIADVRQHFDRVTVYNKSGVPLSDEGSFDQQVALPNVGREAHTFLTHIVRNYDRLADRTMFSQDGFLDKMDPEVFARICKGESVIRFGTIDAPWEHTQVQYHPSYKGCHVVPCGLTQRAFFDTYIFPTPGRTETPWICGAYVTATREEIRRRPREVYQRLLDTGLSKHNNPEEGYLMERAWYALWDKSIHECSWI